jgi:ribosomal protein S18 acetylase RimI-like enzyme
VGSVNIEILNNELKNIYEQNFDVNIENTWNEIINNINDGIMNLIIYLKEYIPIGIAIISNYKEYPDNVHLEYICVSKKYQGYGYGGKMFNLLIKLLKYKIKLLSLECNNELINWYNKLGCQLISINPSVYDNVENTIYYFMIYNFTNNNINNLYEYWYKLRRTLWKVKLIRKYEKFELWSD